MIDWIFKTEKRSFLETSFKYVFPLHNFEGDYLDNSKRLISIIMSAAVSNALSLKLVPVPEL